TCSRRMGRCSPPRDCARAHSRYTARSSQTTGCVRHVRALGELTAVSPVYREARFFGRYVWIAWPASSSLRSTRSEEHTSELQSRFELVCRLLLEKKNNYRLTSASHDRRWLR